MSTCAFCSAPPPSPPPSQPALARLPPARDLRCRHQGACGQSLLWWRFQALLPLPSRLLLRCPSSAQAKCFLRWEQYPALSPRQRAISRRNRARGDARQPSTVCCNQGGSIFSRLTPPTPGTEEQLLLVLPALHACGSKNHARGLFLARNTPACRSQAACSDGRCHAGAGAAGASGSELHMHESAHSSCARRLRRPKLAWCSR
mmetsp:Transcript_40213/g.95467  ORF Transcript_40213/g.95467 Transcript_40213/m.95467 type:complete len:203 (+) Transcript_40213:3180-3788(+)